MDYEIMVEDRSGKEMLEILMPMIFSRSSSNNTFRIISYKGIGRLPGDLRTATDPKKRLLLNQLPRLIKGYGNIANMYPFVLIFVADLDNKDCIEFKNELVRIERSISPRPDVLFRIAIEEMESWLLGDTEAVQTAFPKVKRDVIESYEPDSICGTWETLADAIYEGGSGSLIKSGYPTIGIKKSEWARTITPHINIERNRSMSFQVFVEGIRRFMD